MHTKLSVCLSVSLSVNFALIEMLTHLKKEKNDLAPSTKYTHGEVNINSAAVC